MKDRLLTASEVAARWGVHKATVLRLFHSGVLPGITLCLGQERTTVRFRPETILVWERTREKKGMLQAKRGAA